MAEFKLTPAQEAAVSHFGSPLLISAGAGSGKTRVLVERILRLVEQTGADIDSFLVITYTRAAAAELRGRILDGLYRRLADNPSNRHLRRQTALVYRAQISTIHGFCSAILREYAHLCRVRPDFRQLDEAEERVIKAQVMDKLLEERYISMSEGFRALTDTMGAGRDDSGLVQIALDTYSQVQSHPYPERWLAERISEPLPCGDVGDTPWGRLLLDRAKSRCGYWIRRMEAELEEINTIPEAAKAYAPSFSETAASLRRFYSALDKGWDSTCRFGKIDFPALTGLRGFRDCAPLERAKNVRKRCKTRMDALVAGFDALSAEHIADIAAVRPCTDELFRLVLDFSAAYAAEKKRRGVLDFADLEHIALHLLVHEDTGLPTPRAKEISRRYSEILVDEYQDCNRVQDAIFRAVSADGANITMVGDVKQSIYRFRLADPSIFTDKYRSFSDDVPESGVRTGRRINLQENFRSSGGVIDAVNELFGLIMTEELGELDYGRRESLISAAEQTPCEGLGDDFRLCAVETGGDDRLSAEADAVADMIREILDSKATVDGHPVAAEDITVLLRSASGRDAVFAAALEKRGIPAFTQKSGEGLAERREISYALSILQTVDNPRQDIPLIAAMRSPVWGFTADELAEIRAADKAACFYDALCLAAGDDRADVSRACREKCRRFIDELTEFRLYSADMPTDRLISHIYSKTLLPAAAEAMEPGSSENLYLLLDYAHSYEQSGYRGLFSFITQLREAIENNAAPLRGSGAKKRGVQIGTVHSSKGLEYPIVILADLAKRFNKSDSRKPLIIHPRLGVGPKYADRRRGIEYPTLPRLAIAAQTDRETLSEEMRILYVAMTRAKYKLIAVCAVKDIDKTLSTLAANAGIPVEHQALEDCQSLSEWMLTAAQALGRNIECIGTQAEAEDAPQPLPEAERLPDAELTARIKEGLQWRYARTADTVIPSKLTATELKGSTATQEAAEEADSMPAVRRERQLRRPRFVSEQSGLTPSEKGTALHLVMQYIDYSRCSSRAEVAREIERLAAIRMITPAQAEAASENAVKIAAFFASGLGQRVLSADGVLREFKFSVLVPAAEHFPGARGEILLQGVVDCCIEQSGELTVIDFKSDRVNRANETERAETYRPQLAAYACALERITGKPVKQRLIYFFATGNAIEI